MDKSSRPARNRRHTRRNWSTSDHIRPAKRLFTPEIKRMLKDWLVRRRDNPYPNRDEKKILANETGLTYTQICNWFANWRRKLKNSGREEAERTWGNLIKNYNTNAKGNVEQFSICSCDSIWGDEEHNPPSISTLNSEHDDFSDIHMNFNKNNNNNNNNSFEKRLCYSDQLLLKDNLDYFSNKNYLDSKNITENYLTNDTKNNCNQVINLKMAKSEQYFVASTKYKQQIMEKYWRDTKNNINNPNNPELSKWLESTANFTPNKNNYIDWNYGRYKSEKRRRKDEDLILHQKEELDAAEALANLASNYRQRLINSNNYS